MYYVYVLLSLKDNKFYIGFTGDLRRRIKEHNTGKNISTKPRLPFKLFYYEAHLSRDDAERREQYFKTTKGKSTLRQMLRNSLEEFCLTITTVETNLKLAESKMVGGACPAKSNNPVVFVAKKQKEQPKWEDI